MFRISVDAIRASAAGAAPSPSWRRGQVAGRSSRTARTLPLGTPTSTWRRLLTAFDDGDALARRSQSSNGDQMSVGPSLVAVHLLALPVPRGEIAAALRRADARVPADRRRAPARTLKKRSPPADEPGPDTRAAVRRRDRSRGRATGRRDRPRRSGHRRPPADAGHPHRLRGVPPLVP